ncbi:hypothetical protein [uncultured Lutibacter sp.]|uniref:DoxX family protein n=1 Tax=uncultured Lutibacter sp. TaxID=437739 RepID=UPI002636CE7A|nr:hypothetical protein [uncultured Lutibacter sp.]
MQQKIWTILKIVLGFFLIFGGIQHFIKPDFYIPFVPEFLPFIMPIIYVSGFVEILVGVLVFIKKYEKIGAWGILILMLLFLPIHIWDIFSDTPAIGSQKAAFIRLPIQFLLIAIAWKVKNLVSHNKSTL